MAASMRKQSDKMWKAEEDFPRGGALPKKSGLHLKSGEKTDFQTASDKLSDAGEKTKKLKSRKRRLSDSVTPQSDVEPKRPKKEPKPQHAVIDIPLHQDLVADMCVLGCVRQSHDYSVSVSLPGNVVGTLPITNISNSYTQLLHALAESADQDRVEEVRSTDEIFKPGMLLPVVVKEITEDKSKNKKMLKLTILPSIVNSGIRLKGVEDGMLLFGSVSSVEDHGYRVDLGFKGMEAFLSSSDADKFIAVFQQGIPLCVGQPLWCVLKMKDSTALKAGESRVVNVTIDPELVQRATVPQKSGLSSLAPGMSVISTVQSVTDNGLHVSMLSFEGTIHSSQLPKACGQYKIGDEVPSRILYIHPSSKLIQLSALTPIVQFRGGPLQLFGDLSVGHTTEGILLYTVRRKGAYFRLPNKIKAFAPMKQLSDQENTDITKFKKNASYKCRVLGFNFMEGVALITLRQSILEQKFLSVQEISAGDIVEVVVKDVTPAGVVVKLSKGIYSFIPGLQLADVPIKNPEKKFQAGMILKCRVLRVDREKSKVYLTHKHSLVESKYPLVTDYSQLLPGMDLEGYVVAVKENVVVVAFLNNVKGILLMKNLGPGHVDKPSSMFYMGQVVRTRVLHFNVADKKLKLTLGLGSKKSDSKEKQTAEHGSNYPVGSVVKARVMRAEKDRFRVSLQPKGDVAFLPFCHLSDFHEIQELRKLALRPGQLLNGVMVFCTKQQTIVTMKESFLQAAVEKAVVDNFDDLKMGALFPAVIKNHQEYGMFVELPAGYTGLCPTKNVTYTQPASLPELFQPGQTVITRLLRTDSEKKRFLSSLRLEECQTGGIGSSLGLLKDYMLSRRAALNALLAEREELSMYKDLKVGQVVEVTISSVLKKGILGDLAGGAKVLATKVNLGGVVPKVASKYPALVLFVDLLTPCVELSLDPKLIKAVISRKETSKSQLKCDQVLKADVLLVKPEFMLMSLRGHGAGKLIYVPARQHINDVAVERPYEPGTFTEVVLKDTLDEDQLAILKSQEHETKKEETTDKSVSLSKGKQDVKCGNIVDAKIRAIHPLQINVMVGHFQGRVHISEIADKLEKGENPLSKFRQHQILKVKIIGLRDMKSSSYLPITRPMSSRCLLECSLKESKVKSDVEDSLLTPQVEVKKGAMVTAYVMKISDNKVWFQVGLNQQGYVDMFHLSSDVTVLNDVHNQFTTGQAYEVTVLDSEQDKLVLSRLGTSVAVAEGQVVTSQIISIKPDGGLHVKLVGGRLGVVPTHPSVLHYEGQFIRCQVTAIESSGWCTLALSDQSHARSVRVRKRKNQPMLTEADKNKKAADKEIIKKKKQEKLEKHKRLEEAEDQVDSGVDVTKESSDSDRDVTTAGKKSKQTDKEQRLVLPGFSWEGELSAGQVGKQADSDDSGDEDAKGNFKNLKKKRKRDEERIIEEYERSQLEGSSGPATANDFEKLALQSPSSSVVWLRYMAFHIEQGEIEKARAVAEKALSTISFREEQEKKNVWLAYLNMETMYGDSGDVKKLLERAVTYNDALDLYLKMCDIYTAAGKSEETETLYLTLTRKFKKKMSVWKAYGQFLFKSRRAQTARNLLQRCISVMDKKDHVEMIAKFANLEFTDGDKERGGTMFENLIASYPGRTDLWSVYVDMVVKVGDIEGARQILERAIKQKMSTKKLSFLVQKYIRFEEAHGTEDQLQLVKDMALTLLS